MSKYRYEADFKELFPGAEWEPSGGSNFLTNCPFHEHLESKTFAIDFETGLWHCFNPDCGAKGKGVQQLAKRLKRQEQYTQFEHALVSNNPLDDEVLQYLKNERGLTLETIKRYRIVQSTEYAKHWLTGVLEPKKYVLIPIFDSDGNLIAGRKYLLPAYRGEKDSKIKFAWTGSPVTFYPASSLSHNTLVLAEGEWDALLLNQHGIPAITTTGGAGYDLSRLAPQLRGKTIYICYDCDESGRKGAKRAAEALLRNGAAQVHIIDLGLEESEDVTDFFVKYGRTKEDFLQFLNDAPLYEAPAPPDLTMSQLGADHINHRYVVKARVLGEAGIHKFIWPQHSVLTCDGAKLEVCAMCPLFTSDKTVTLSPSDPKIIYLMEQPPDKQRAFIAAQAGIPFITSTKRCNFWRYAEGSKAELAVPVFIESTDEDVPDSKKELAGYVTTEKASSKLRSGKQAYFWMTPVQDIQKDGKLMFLAEEVIPMQDDIDTFCMTPDLFEKLKVFQGNPFEKIPEIAQSLNRNVFRIRGREDLIIAYDLSYHSVIGLPNPNAPGRIVKGWTELLVIGDPGEGKSQLAMEMHRYYDLGAIQDAATATPGGLTVATVQMGGKWIFKDGLLPLNDRRLVFIDEFNKLPTEDLGKLNTSRSSGKITASSAAGSYEKDARVRLVWITNPKDGQRINVGREAVAFPIKLVADLFRDRGAQDRLDMAVLILRQDPKPEFPDPPAVAEDPVYTKHLCRSLILWAWSRRPDQIRFTKEAVQEIRLASDRLRREFWHPDSEIELINSGERTTERIMRLSAAVASRVFSTADGENLFITKEHVQFVEQFLRKQYTKFEFDHYIQSLRTQQRVSAAIRDQQQQKTEEEKAQDKLKAITRTRVVSLLVQNKLFFDTLRSGKYDLMAEKDSERRAAIGWMYNEGYVHSEEGRYFQFTKAFYEELEPELNTTEPLAQPY
mgnify:CR=1 FL=1